MLRCWLLGHRWTPWLCLRQADCEICWRCGAWRLRAVSPVERAA